jgi:hypothetical protein
MVVFITLVITQLLVMSRLRLGHLPLLLLDLVKVL